MAQVKLQSLTILVLKKVYNEVLLKKIFTNPLPGILPLIDTLIQLLERTAQPHTVTLLLNAIIPLSESYKTFFVPHFQNIVDILIGWHIDSEQVCRGAYGFRL